MAHEELKQRQGAMWGSAPYERVAGTIADIHERVVERLDPRPGRRWLDLACGTGAVAEQAAARGADVTGVDLAPALIETATAAGGRARPRDRLPGRRLRAPRTARRAASTRCPRPAG